MTIGRCKAKIDSEPNCLAASDMKINSVYQSKVIFYAYLMVLVKSK